MSKKKRPAEEGKDISKGYVEIPMPELVNDSFEKERVFQYGTARWAYGFLLFIIVGCVLTAVTEIPNGLFLVWGFLLILTVALLLLAKYEIRHDREGFSVCLGGRVLRRHEWSEVSGVTEKKRVLVNGLFLRFGSILGQWVPKLAFWVAVRISGRYFLCLLSEQHICYAL